MENLVRVSISLPPSLLASLDEEILRRGIPNRSEALRKMILRFSAEGSWEGEGAVCGTLTLLYDHGSHDAATELTELQHSFPRLILCSTHAHLDSDHCLETVLLRGSSADFRRFVQAVSSFRAVRCSEPVVFPEPARERHAHHVHG
jgi:CopG family nickel-responsive transcriptional regulator